MTEQTGIPIPVGDIDDLILPPYSDWHSSDR